MYIPKLYQMNDDEAVQMMKTHPFALLITVDEKRPIATHIPVEVHEQDGKVYVTGHLAYGNMQKNTLENREVLLIFQGPHAYISSSWYGEEQPPTWNYLAVHAYGNARVISEEELRSALIAMLDRYESPRENGRLWHTFDPDFLESQMKGIVGFEITITLIEAKAKMSQNRSDTDYQSIVSELGKSNEQDEIHVAAWMRERRKGLFS